MTITITGARGRLGRALSPLMATQTPGRELLDITNRQMVENYIRLHRPETFIHLAAYTSPAKCLMDKIGAWNTNVEGTRYIVHALEKYVPDCYFFLMSTPCIFNGEEETEHEENDFPDTENFYGLVKAMQEMIVKESRLTWVIVRSNFVSRVKWEHPVAFSDRYSYYLFADTLAEQIRNVIDKRMTGIVHIAGDTKMSMHEFALKCPDSQDVKPITLEEFYKGKPLPKLTKYMLLKSNLYPKVKFV